MINLSAQRISGSDVLPIVEGGKGISISTGQTCGAWAAAGGVGTFSAVNADCYDVNGAIVPQIHYAKSRKERHREMIEYAVSGGITQAKIAREISGGRGRIHMNVLWEMAASEEITTRILEGSKGCIHGVVCGAGLPYKLAEITSSFGVYYYPIVSSARAFSILFKRSYNKHADFLGGVVYEDPWLAGGHNGLSNAENPLEPMNPYLRVVELRKVMNSFGLQNIPLIIAGGVWWLSEWEDYINNSELGIVAFQFGTRSLLTTESPVLEFWREKLMSLKQGDVKLTQLSPTGFYSSAVCNSMLQEMLDINSRQVNIVENSACEVSVGNSQVYLDDARAEDVQMWTQQGFSCALKTPDNTVVFVSETQKARILKDQKECCGCLSACRFSSWSQHTETFNTGRIPDPRTFCIQKNLQSVAHGGSVDDGLLFAGHQAYRFSQDPFYDNGFIPTTQQLIDRIMTGY